VETGRHERCIFTVAMAPRVHLGLRLGSVIVLLLCALVPRSRSTTRDRGGVHVAAMTHLAVTTAARRHADDAPRPARLRVVESTPDPVAEGDGDITTLPEPLATY